MPSVRPPLSRSLTGAEFRRWYWLKSELLVFARAEGLALSGDKPTLANRIVGLLDGLAVGPSSSSSRPVSRRLPEPLTFDTVLGPNQASSQQLRAFFVRAIGRRFSYDIHMRTFLASDHAKTLGEAVAHWHATRDAVKPETLPQLELVRFTKAWHLKHPEGTQAECRKAWKLYKALPADEREPLD
jgi:SAP domain-containing new25/Domain of unknown function (DUF6434)